jgi:DNA processing protein
VARTGRGVVSVGAMEAQTFTPEELLGLLNDVERKNAPERLYVAGKVELLRRGTRVSIVGSRKASAEGLRRTRAISKALVERGVTVVSGLAEGVDSAAHEAALAAGGHTLAVIGTPLDKFYPAKNRALQERLMRDELVVSQFPQGYPVQPKSFPMRNRTMALLTDATVIVEAGEKSGTLHQGWEALRLGRLLFLMESVATDAALSWPKAMIGYGAQVLSRENLELVLDEMPEFTRAEPIAL